MKLAAAITLLALTGCAAVAPIDEPIRTISRAQESECAWVADSWGQFYDVCLAACDAGCPEDIGEPAPGVCPLGAVDVLDCYPACREACEWFCEREICGDQIDCLAACGSVELTEAGE